MEETIRSARKEANDEEFGQSTLQDLLYRETVLGKKLEAKDALLEKKTDALVRANEIVSGLEQRLAFSKIDDPFYTQNGIRERQNSKFMSKESTGTSYQDDLGVGNTNLATKGVKVNEDNNAHVVHKDDRAVLTKKSLGSLLHRMDLSSSLNGDNTSVNYTSFSDEKRHYGARRAMKLVLYRTYTVQRRKWLTSLSERRRKAYYTRHGARNCGMSCN